MQSVYSWMGTPLHLMLEDDLAAAYNRAQDAFHKAQQDHKTRTGTQWEPIEALYVEWTEEEQNAFNRVADIVNLIIEVNGGSLDIKEDQVTSDHLIKL